MKPVKAGGPPESVRDDDELHWELAPARPHRRELDPPLQDGAFAGREVAREAGAMGRRGGAAV